MLKNLDFIKNNGNQNVRANQQLGKCLGSEGLSWYQEPCCGNWILGQDFSPWIPVVMGG